MHKPLSIAARVLLVLFVVATLPSLIITSLAITSYASGPGGHPCNPGNLIPNCGFDQFAPVAQGEAPAGWTPFVVSGSLAMDSSPDTYWGAPSLRMWSDGTTFDAGIYTQVGGLTPGATYYASMGWGPSKEPRDSFSRRLGIDPTGGANPNSPNVVWGPEWRWTPGFQGHGRVMNDTNPPEVNLDVSAVAKGSTVTVFVRVNHNYAAGANEIFIDAVGLYQNTAAPVVVAAVDTPKPAPAVAAPVAAPTKAKAPVATKRAPTATATRTATRTATLAPTATPSATNTPAPTATHTFTPTPQDTATPSVTPSSTLPSRPRATAAPAATAVAAATEAAPRQVLLFGGIGALAGAGLLSIGVVLRRRS